MYNTENRTMNQLTPTSTETLSHPICPNCGTAMRLFGIEAHPTVDRTDLLTYVCDQCDEVQTENVPQLKLKGEGYGFTSYE
jgi:hypothetical protein